MSCVRLICCSINKSGDNPTNVRLMIYRAHGDVLAGGAAEVQLPDEIAVSDKNMNMNAEEGGEVVAPPATKASVPVSSDMPTDEKPLCGKGSYAIDWDNFDENAVPNPFGGRPSVPRAPKTRGPGAKSPRQPPAAAQGPRNEKADNNANEVQLTGSPATTAQNQPAPDLQNAAEDEKNANNAAAPMSIVDAQPASANDKVRQSAIGLSYAI